MGQQLQRVCIGKDAPRYVCWWSGATPLSDEDLPDHWHRKGPLTDPPANRHLGWVDPDLPKDEKRGCGRL